MGNRFVDLELIKKYPNKYNFTPQNVKTIKVLNWEELKKHTWFNKAMNEPCWCHLEGCNLNGEYDDSDEFWIGFYEDGKVDCYFTCFEGMCSYNFAEFYNAADIENKFDMGVQVNAIKYLNKLVDDGIISKPVMKNNK